MPRKEGRSTWKWDEAVAKYDRNLRYEELLAALRLGFYSRIAYDLLAFFGASVDTIDKSLSLLADVIPNTNLYAELRRLLSVIEGRFQQRYQLSCANDPRQIFVYPTDDEDARLVRECNRAIPRDLPHWQWYCLGAFFGELHARPNREENELQLSREFVDAYLKEFGKGPDWQSTCYPPLDEKVEEDNSLLHPLQEICARLPQQVVQHSPLLKALTELPADALNVQSLRDIVLAEVSSPRSQDWMPGCIKKDGLRGLFRVAYYLFEAAMEKSTPALSTDHVGNVESAGQEELKPGFLGIICDGEQRVVSRQGWSKKVTLRRQPWEIMQILVKKKHNWARRRDLEVVWEGVDATADDHAMNTAISVLRKKLKCLGLGIENDREGGWRLKSIEDEPARDRLSS